MKSASRHPYLQGALLSLLAIFVAASCSVKLDIPTGSQVACLSDGECPQGQICSLTLEKCVRVSGADNVAPVISGQSVIPATVGLTAPVTIVFSVSEPLLEDPVARVQLPSGGQCTLNSHDGEQYTFTYPATGNEPPGQPIPILADVVDVFGNEAIGVSLGVITFDFDAPVISEIEADPRVIGPSDTVTVSFRVSEALGTEPRVSWSTGAALTFTDNPEALVYRFNYTATGSELEGAVDVELGVVDVAGNGTNVGSTAVATFDFTAPTVQSSTVLREAVRSGQTAAVDVTFSETLASAPVVEFVPRGGGIAIPMAIGAQLGTTYSLSYTVQPADPDDIYDLQLNAFLDTAGNSGTSIIVGTVTVDNAGPAFATSPTVDRQSVSEQSGADTVVVSFSFSEVPASVDVLVGAALANCVESGAAPMVDYECSYTVADTDTSGPKTVTVVAVDAAGNATFAPAPTVEFDFDVPSLSLSVTPSGRPARAGEAMNLTLTSSEPLASTSLDNDGLDLTGPTTAGNQTTWTYSVSPGEAGSFDVSAAGIDLAGNSAATPATLTLEVDGQDPAATSPTFSTTSVSPGGTFSLSFTASEVLGNTPTVTFSNGVEAPFSMALQSNSGLDYVFEGTGPTEATSAINYTVVVAMTDVAGNQRSQTVGTVEIDTVPPAVSGLEVAPRGAKLGDTVRVVLTADEPMNIAPTLEVIGPDGDVATPGGRFTLATAPASPTPNKISYTYVVPITAVLPNGAYVLQPFELADSASNTASYDPNGAVSFTVDTELPSAQAMSVVTDAPATDMAIDGTIVTFTFTSSEALSQAPAATIGGETMSGSSSGNDYTFTYTVSQGDDAAGIKTVIVELNDDAGNRSS